MLKAKDFRKALFWFQCLNVELTLLACLHRSQKCRIKNGWFLSVISLKRATAEVIARLLTDIISFCLVPQKVKHAKISDQVEDALQNKKFVSGLDSSRLDMCYPPIIQSGGHYALKFSVVRLVQH